jgi:thiol-disulfide isomerase/thioredoxin
VSLLLVVAVLSGCSSQSQTERSVESPAQSTNPSTDEAASPTADSNESTPAPGGDEPAVEVPELLQFEATTLDGAAFDGSSLVGKPTVLWFWAPWCTTCIAQIPQVEALATEYAGDANVVGVGGLDSDSAIEDFAADLDGLTSLVDDEGAIWQRFEIIEQSSFVILDANGNEVARSGYGDELDLSSEVAGLVN